MELIKKCFSCKDKHEKENYWQDVYADNRNQAKSIHANSAYDDATYISTICHRNHKMDIVRLDGEEMSRYLVASHLEQKEWRAKIDALVAEKPNEKCLIFSGQWGMWWRSRNAGYTEEKKEAGIYSVLDAYNSVYHCGIEKRIELQII